VWSVGIYHRARVLLPRRKFGTNRSLFASLISTVLSFDVICGRSNDKSQDLAHVCYSFALSSMIISQDSPAEL